MSFFQYIKPDRIPAFMKGRDDLHIQREIILQNILNTVFIFGLVAFVFYGFYQKWVFERSILVITVAGLVGFFLITVIRRLPFVFRSLMLLLALGTVATIDLLHNGLSGNGSIYMLTLAGLSAALFGIKIGLGSILLVGGSQAFIGWLMLTSRVHFPTFAAMVTSGEPLAWGYSIFSMTLCSIALTTSIFQFSSGLSRSLNELRQASRLLEKEHADLEMRVNERTQEITLKASQLEAARKVAATIANQTDLSTLLQNSVDVVRGQFNYYYTAIFVPDENKEFAVLAAGTGEAGNQMLQRRHSLKIGEVGIVGYVMSSGEPRVAGNVEEDPAHYQNPYLPETRSEMGVPMRIGNQVVGVLDVQSERRNAFTADDIDLLQTIADQLASALDRARALEQHQKSLAELKLVAQANTQREWKQHLSNTNQHVAYRYSQSKVEAIPVNPQQINALLQQESDVLTMPDGEFTSVALPIKLRNQPLGIVNLRLTSKNVSPELIDLLTNAVERMALSLDNVRLVEEIQIRADRERMVGEISSRVRAATDVESILQIAANELGQSLGVAEVVIQLAPGGEAIQPAFPQEAR